MDKNKELLYLRNLTNSIHLVDIIKFLSDILNDLHGLNLLIVKRSRLLRLEYSSSNNILGLLPRNFLIKINFAMKLYSSGVLVVI
jgi:hypothetical protein